MAAPQKSAPSAKDLRGMTEQALKEKLAETQEQLMQDRFRHATAALENTSELKSLRRQIARIETVLNQKKQRN